MRILFTTMDKLENIPRVVEFIKEIDGLDELGFGFVGFGVFFPRRNKIIEKRKYFLVDGKRLNP